MKQSSFYFFPHLMASMKSFFVVLLILAVTCLVTSCSHPSSRVLEPQELLPGWSKETVTITLPDYPVASHPPLAGWKIIYWNESGSHSLFVSPNQQKVSLTMKKNIPAAILCYPLTTVAEATVRFFHPAACIYPYNNTATWEEGFSAELFFQLAQKKSLQELRNSPLLRFNWPRLTQQVIKRFQQAQEKGKIFSPWFLQQNGLKADIQQGKASTRSIKQENILEIKATELDKKEISTTASREVFSQPLYYRYIPLGTVQDTIFVPQNEGFTLHQENAFLQENNIVSLFTKKNQKPVLVTIGIERYTDK